MKICQTTDYYKDCVEFFRRKPECDYTTFDDDDEGEGGFSYINSSLNLALAVQRTSKSNYDVTVIVDGTIYTATEHSLAAACTNAQTVIQNARKG